MKTRTSPYTGHKKKKVWQVCGKKMIKQKVFSSVPDPERLKGMGGSHSLLQCRFSYFWCFLLLHSANRVCEPKPVFLSLSKNKFLGITRVHLWKNVINLFLFIKS